MLGSSLYRAFRREEAFEVYGTYRSDIAIEFFPDNEKDRLIFFNAADGVGDLEEVISFYKIDTVINCIGIIKQRDEVSAKKNLILYNALLPHELLKICSAHKVYLIHFSTDCVFSGKVGNYSENDPPDACDDYGMTKNLGEISSNLSLTLRTSIIGHEVNSAISLIDWCLSQNNEIRGFKKAIFSGLPTIEISCVLKNILLKRENLVGLYHLSAQPIDKYLLLEKVIKKYRKKLKIVPDDEVVINRSLNSIRLQDAIQYCPPDWDTLINAMYCDYHNHKKFFGLN